MYIHMEQSVCASVTVHFASFIFCCGGLQLRRLSRVENAIIGNERREVVRYVPEGEVLVQVSKMYVALLFARLLGHSQDGLSRNG